MDGNSSFLWRFIVCQVFAKNEGAADPTRVAVVGAVLGQAVGLPLALVLTRSIIAQETEAAAETPPREDKKPVHHPASHDKKKEKEHAPSHA
jgi:hypothetical protein